MPSSGKLWGLSFSHHYFSVILNAPLDRKSPSHFKVIYFGCDMILICYPLRHSSWKLHEGKQLATRLQKRQPSITVTSRDYQNSSCKSCFCCAWTFWSATETACGDCLIPCWLQPLMLNTLGHHHCLTCRRKHLSLLKTGDYEWWEGESGVGCGFSLRKLFSNQNRWSQVPLYATFYVSLILTCFEEGINELWVDFVCSYHLLIYCQTRTKEEGL